MVKIEGVKGWKDFWYLIFKFIIDCILVFWGLLIIDCLFKVWGLNFIWFWNYFIILLLFKILVNWGINFVLGKYLYFVWIVLRYFLIFLFLNLGLR